MRSTLTATIGLICICFGNSMLQYGFADTHGEKAHAKSNDQPTSTVEELVQELGHPLFERRREAFLHIWKLGSPAKPALQMAQKSEKLQVAQAARALLPLLSLEGVDPSSDVYELILEPDKTKIVSLCRKGYWVLAEKLIADDNTLRQTLHISATPLLAELAAIAAKQGDPLKSWPIVRNLKSPRLEEYQGSDQAIWLGTKLGLKLNEENLLPDQAALKLLYAGKIDEAEQLPMSELLKLRFYSRFARWDAFKTPEVRNVYLQNRRGIGRNAAEALMLEYAGNFRAADELWSKVLGLEPGGETTARESSHTTAEEKLAVLDLLKQAPGIERNQLILALLAAGLGDAIPEYLKSAEPDAAFSFYTSEHDYASAFKLLGLEADLSNFESWLTLQEQKINSQAIRGSRANLDSFKQAGNCCGLLIGLGYQAEAERYLEILCEAAKTNMEVWRAIIPWLSRADPRRVALPIIEKHFLGATSRTRSEILQAFFPEFGSLAPVLVKNLPKFDSDIYNTPPPMRTLEKLYAWDTRYFESQGVAVEKWLRGISEILVEKARRQEQISVPLQELAKLAKGCGFSDLALELALMQVPGMGREFPLQRVVAAEILMEQGQAERAASILEDIRARTGINVDQTLLMQESKALLLAGRFKDAVQLDQMRQMSPPKVNRYYQGMLYWQPAMDLIDAGEYEAAAAYFDIGFQHAETASIDFYWAASEIAKVREEQEDYLAGADALRAGIIECLKPQAPALEYQRARRGMHSLRFAAKNERIYRAASCIEKRDFAAAAQHIKIGQRIQPQDIEMVVVCYPRLIAAHRTKSAEELFLAYERTMKEQLKQWPNDAMTLNNLAWMYARCDQNLDEAFELAQKAVSIAQGSATYLDTLAEVHYRSGRVDAAIAAMEECVRIDPREQHYHENLERFALGLP